VYGAEVPKAKIGEFDAELAEEFFRAFFMNARITAHIDILRDGNLHHMLEACFKATGLALYQACSASGDGSVLSTKGTLNT
jgi:imidazoleglycerol-phosphate dehydratase